MAKAFRGVAFGVWAAIAFALSALSVASAATIPNPNFIDGAYGGGAFFTVSNPGNPGAIDGWTVTSGSVDWIDTYWTPPPASPAGTRTIDLNGNSASSFMTTIIDLVIGQQYTVSFLMSGNPDGGDPSKDLQVNANGVLGFYNFNTLTEGNTLANMGWLTKNITFVASAVTAGLVFNTLEDGAFGPAIANLSIVETPIPPALILFLSGLFGVGWLARRRSKAKLSGLA